jgi:hypothetical protein
MITANNARELQGVEDTSSNYIARILCKLDWCIRGAAVQSRDTTYETMLNKEESALVRKTLKAEGFKVSITAVRPSGYFTEGGIPWDNPQRGKYNRRDMIIKICW